MKNAFLLIIQCLICLTFFFGSSMAFSDSPSSDLKTELDTKVSRSNVDNNPSQVKKTEMQTSPSKPVKRRVIGKSDEVSYEGKVVVIKVGKKDLLNKQAFNFWRRVLKRVNEEKARAVVFELNTPGGLAMDTADLIMGEMQKLKVPSYAFVNQKALSAGALVASGTDAIYMHPLSVIGAAAIVSGDGQEMPKTMRKKLESAFGAFVQTVAENKGRNPDVIKAMMFVEKSYDFGEVKVGKGELLTLTAKQAVKKFKGKPILAKGIVNSIDELLAKEGLEGVEIIIAKPSGMEQFAYWVTAFSAVLIIIGIGGAYLEMKTPGFGLGGGISLLAFGLFFFGNYVAGNMANYGLMVLFVIGIILVVVEFFLLPGMILPGIVGGLLIVGSLFFAMVDEFAFDDIKFRGVGNDGALDVFTWPAMMLALGFVGAAVVIILLMKYLPSIPLFNKLIMQKELTLGDGTDDDALKKSIVRQGEIGEALTDLRPSGKGKFGDVIVDIAAANGFIESGKKVKILSEDGLRILVAEESP